ncbi:hypothetical protein [Candidatus Phytoplasma solani]
MNLLLFKKTKKSKQPPQPYNNKHQPPQQDSLRCFVFLDNFLF